MRLDNAEILVVGAGPAGIAAAVRAAETGRRVTVLDDNPYPGGQIWRGEQVQPSNSEAARWLRRLHGSGAEIISGARVISGNAESKTVLVEREDTAFEIAYEKLILATGARELFLPFPGWTLPNIMGVGGLQALVKSGLPVQGKRIIVAGSGPLLLAAAAYFRKRGAIVPLIAEQASRTQLAAFTWHLLRHLRKLWLAITLRLSLRRSRYSSGCWIERAEGEQKVTAVYLRRANKISRYNCDYLATAYGLAPNTELASLLGCELTQQAVVRVDSSQQTSTPHVYCCGEPTTVGGLDLSIVEGEIAGYAAGGYTRSAQNLEEKRQRALRFAAALNRAFSLRPELRNLPHDETVVCRCEDVVWGRLKSADSWRSAKLHTRSGMGPCQGRICGPILEFLLGLHPESVRPPVLPARVETLLGNYAAIEEITK